MHHFNELTPAEAERLAVLAEEAGEIVQAVGKILRHGYDSCHPVSGVSNRASLEWELGDFVVSMGMLANTHDVSVEAIEARAAVKDKQIAKYLHHNRRMSDLELI